MAVDGARNAAIFAAKVLAQGLPAGAQAVTGLDGGDVRRSSAPGRRPSRSSTGRARAASAPPRRARSAGRGRASRRALAAAGPRQASRPRCTSSPSACWRAALGARATRSSTPFFDGSGVETGVFADCVLSRCLDANLGGGRGCAERGRGARLALARRARRRLPRPAPASSPAAARSRTSRRWRRRATAPCPTRASTASSRAAAPSTAPARRTARRVAPATAGPRDELAARDRRGRAPSRLRPRPSWQRTLVDEPRRVDARPGRRGRARRHHEHRRRRSDRRDRRVSVRGTASGCTSTAPTARRPPPRRRRARSSPASSASTRSRSTRTSGCSCRRPAARCSCATRRALDAAFGEEAAYLENVGDGPWAGRRGRSTGAWSSRTPSAASRSGPRCWLTARTRSSSGSSTTLAGARAVAEPRARRPDLELLDEPPALGSWSTATAAGRSRRDARSTSTTGALARRDPARRTGLHVGHVGARAASPLAAWPSAAIAPAACSHWPVARAGAVRALGYPVAP